VNEVNAWRRNRNEINSEGGVEELRKIQNKKEKIQKGGAGRGVSLKNKRHPGAVVTNNGQ
jgi:hypothetical protein